MTRDLATRGRQGNALKTLLPMAYVLGGKGKGETWIGARGVKHRILFTVNQIKQEPIVNDFQGRSRMPIGTRVTVFWPDTDEAIVDADKIIEPLKQFIWVNPHLALKFVETTMRGKLWNATSAANRPAWRDGVAATGSRGSSPLC